MRKDRRRTQKKRSRFLKNQFKAGVLKGRPDGLSVQIPQRDEHGTRAIATARTRKRNLHRSPIRPRFIPLPPIPSPLPSPLQPSRSPRQRRGILKRLGDRLYRLTRRRRASPRYELSSA